MKTRRTALICLILGFSFGLAYAQPATKPTKPATRQSQDPTVPAIKDPKRHEGFLADLKAKNGKVGFLLVGDSITDGWRGGGKTVFEKEFASYDPLNIGIGGDRTQHVIWRLQNGEVEGISPKVAMVMIGTNNLGGNTNEDIVRGVTKVVTTLREKLPQTKILLLGIFPRGAASHAYRGRVTAINTELAKLDDGGKTIKYLDISKSFLDDKNEIPKDVMPDGLHPNAKGYQIWADAVRDTLKEMMK